MKLPKEVTINKQDLIDWIDRQPSNDDLDLARFIATRLEKFYDLENQLQQKENIIKEVREKIENTTINCDGVAEDLIDDIYEILDKVSDKE